ncbi:MAG: NACHT domain-containing protein, partial [Saprospiraceae bacterium]|nr:NACHT domain-containing protein [Saprospiraceae bacterium]
MEWLWQWLDKIRTFLTTKFDLGQPDFWGAMFSWVLIGILAFIGLRIYKGTLSGFFFLQRRVVLIPRALRAYQRKLEEATLTIRHSWKLEGQDFRQLLVPVNFETAGSGIRMGIGTFLAQHFGPGLCPRFVLTGEPGSGKSVAMGSIARQVWFLVRNPALVPVLLTFSDIKHVRTQEEMEEAVVKSLQKYQFEKGKRTRRACHYAQTKFYSGDILVLLDGFDELEKSARQQTARFLEAFFSTYPQIPFVISCRTAVWKDSPGVFAMLHPEVVSMVRFNNNDIRQFLSAWQFQGNKSSEQLGELIRTKPYLQTIAENPLMLTIIAYLYAQPKRILPDNRVKFYQECVDALMEEFDNTKQIERANEFQTIDKVTILSHIAYR